MANISDSTRTRFGRRRPYIAFGSFLYAISFFLLCSPPDSSTRISSWFGVFYVVFFLCDTFTNIPHNALGQEVTTSTEERRKLFLAAKLFEGVGTLFAAVLPAAVTYAWLLIWREGGSGVGGVG